MKLVELEDFPWFPQIFRRYQMDFIATIANLLRLYDPISKMEPNSKNPIVIDLCSGNGSSSEDIVAKWNKIIIKTDKYPVADSVRLLDVKHESFYPDKIYLMTNAFHHFDSQNQLDIVSRMKAANAEFYFIEILEPTFIYFIKILIAATIGQVLLTPFIKPFSIKRLLLTYIIPINIFTITYDGMVSVLKSKTQNQYKSLLEPLTNKTYKISVKRINTYFLNSIILIKGNPIYNEFTS